MRTAPLTALPVLAALLWIDALSGGSLAGGVPALLVVAVVACLAGLRSALGPLLAVAAGTVTLLAVADRVAEAGRFSFASDSVFYAVVVLAPALAGWLVATRNRQLATLRALRHDVELRRGVVVRAARAQEQERVERRLDLALAGRLRRIRTDVRAITSADATASGVEENRLVDVETTARSALSELREVLGVLHEGADSAPTAADVALPHLDLPSHRPERTGSGAVPGLLLVLSTVPLAVETALRHQHGAGWLDVVLALAQGGSLVLMRRRPLLGLVALLAAAALQTTLLVALPATVGWLLPGLLAAFLAGHSRTWIEAVIGGLLLVAGSTALSAVSNFFDGYLPGLVMGALAWTAGVLVRARERQVRELRAIAAELARTAGPAAQLAASEQRRELARELHDVGAHALTVVCLQAGAARAWTTRDPSRAAAAVRALRTVVEGPLAELEQSLAVLGRGAPAEPLGAGGLEVIAGLSRALGLEVDISVSGSPDSVPADVARVAYRIVQEALTNAARHAGRTRVQVCLGVADGVVEIRVTDSGRAGGLALPSPGSGLGLHGMRERVEALRGELRVGAVGAGFEVLARLPA